MIGSDVEAELAQYGQVDRHAGAQRFETAALVAGELEDTEQAYIATGMDFADALTSGAVAGSRNAPVCW